MPGGQGNIIGVNPLFVTPFVNELTVDGLAPRPADGGGHDHGQDPPVGLTGDYHLQTGIARGRLDAAPGAPAGLGQRARRCQRRTPTRHADPGSALTPNAWPRARSPFPGDYDGEFRPQLRVNAGSRTPWDIGADELDGNRYLGLADPHDPGHLQPRGWHRRHTSTGTEPAAAMLRRRRRPVTRHSAGEDERMTRITTGHDAPGLPRRRLGWVPPAPPSPAGWSAAPGLGSRFLATAGECGDDARCARRHDGYMTVPGREDDPLYIFGFIPVARRRTVAQLISNYKGHAQHTAPTLDFTAERRHQDHADEPRPDPAAGPDRLAHDPLARFDTPSPLNDGVPEVSVAVPIGQAVHVLLPAAQRRARTCTTATSRTSSTSRWA